MKTYKGYDITVSREPDPYPVIPWEEYDGHGIVSGWEYHRDKRPGELILCSDRHAKRFYDFQETMKQARREGWGKTRAECAERVRADYERLRAWCNDDWWYEVVSVVVTNTATRERVWESSVGMVESDYTGMDEELIAEAIAWIDDNAAKSAPEFYPLGAVG